MADKFADKRALESLARNRREMIALVQTKGDANTQKMLEESERSLMQRLRQAEGLSGPGANSFTATQLRATLAQVRDVLRILTTKMKTELVDRGQQAATGATKHTIDHLVTLDKHFRATATQPLALREAQMFEEASEGVRASMLRRLASSGTPPARGTEVEKPHRAKLGILQRYGVATVERFEKTLQRGLVEKKSWAQMRSDITADSPFLQQAPAHWAKRIVRTEVMGAYNRAGWHALKTANKQLGDMVKILSATFDDRTGADSYAVHGQIRRPDEPFEWWEGLFQHPPNRPNDREIVTPHRVSWPIPPTLKWRTDDDVIKAWKRDGRKGLPPPRPPMTTIAIGNFGTDEEDEGVS